MADRVAAPGVARDDLIVVLNDATLDKISHMFGQLDRARKMLVHKGFDVDSADMDGGLRAALSELAELRAAGDEQRIDYDLLTDVIAEACSGVMTGQGARAVAERALAALAEIDGVTVLHGTGSTEPATEQQGRGQRAALIEADPLQLRLRCHRALRSVQLTEDGLRRRVEAGTASPCEREAWDEVETARFLLGGAR